MIGIVRVVGGFFIGLVAALALLLVTRVPAYEEQSDRLWELKEKYIDARWQLLNHALLLEQLREAKGMVDRVAKILPTEIDASFAPVLAAARRHHLNIEVSPVGKEYYREFYAARGIGIAVTGRFHDLGAFAAELGKAPGCLLLEQLNLGRTSAGVVRMQGVVFAHRYLTEAELEERRKAAKAEKS